MRMLLLTLVGGFLAVAGSAGYVLAQPSDPALYARLDRDARAVLRSVPDGARRDSMLAWAARTADSIETAAKRAPARARTNLRPLAIASTLRSAAAWAATPVLLALLALGTIAGLLRRDRLREAIGFASLTFSYAGKAVVCLAIAAYLYTGLSPLGPPILTLYLWGIAGSVGSCLYFGNLPPNL